MFHFGLELFSLSMSLRTTPIVTSPCYLHRAADLHRISPLPFLFVSSATSSSPCLDGFCYVVDFVVFVFSLYFFACLVVLAVELKM
jgi:hypothetical protein